MKMQGQRTSGSGFTSPRPSTTPTVRLVVCEESRLALFWLLLSMWVQWFHVKSSATTGVDRQTQRVKGRCGEEHPCLWTTGLPLVYSTLRRFSSVRVPKGLEREVV